MRLYSEEWVAAFNEAVAGIEPEQGAGGSGAERGAGGAGGAGAAGGSGGSGAERGAGAAEPAQPERAASFRMLQLVHGGPDGDVRIALSAHEGRVTMVREPGDEPAPDVTVSVQYEDAVALSRGELDPAGLLAAGRVRVRGDLSVLVRGQSLLAATARRVEPLSQGTTS